MKYLEVREFSTITQALNFETSGENKVSGRLEAYSCKSVAADKKLYKFFENKFQEDLLEAASLSPEQSLSHIISPFGPLTESSSRKVLFYLIATLNASFPDYDFRSIKPEQFTHEPDVTAVMNDINSTLFTAGNTSAIRRHNMWENVDANIHLGEASVYSFHPDDDANPFGENGSIWSLHYFFFNRHLKRVVYFSCTCQSPTSYSEEDDEDSYELTDEYPITMQFSDVEMSPRTRPLLPEQSNLYTIKEL